MTRDEYNIGIKQLSTGITKHITKNLNDTEYNEFFDAIGVDNHGFQVVYIKPKTEYTKTTMSNILKRIQ